MVLVPGTGEDEAVTSNEFMQREDCHKLRRQLDPGTGMPNKEIAAE